MATFRDFIVECETYQHSTEAYDLMKECAELQVTAQFLENQEFIQDNSELLTESNITFTEGYFAESVDSATIANIENSFYEKANGITTKIGNGFKKIISTFVNFLVKIANKFDTLTHAANQIKAAIKKNGDSYDEAMLNKIADALKQAKNSSGFVPSPFDPSKDAFNKKIAAKVITANNRGTQNPGYLYAALSDTYVYADTQGYKDGTPLNAEDIDSVLSKISKAKYGKVECNAEFKAINSFIEELQKNQGKNGIKINVNSKSLGKTIESLKSKLEELEKKSSNIKDVISNGQGAADKYIEINNKKKMLAMNAYQFDSIYSRMVKIVGNSLKLYTALYNYRNTAIFELSKVVLGKEVKNKNESQPETVPAGA